MSESVRTLKDIPLQVLQSLAKATPDQSKRYVREILARVASEDATIKNAGISSHAQDAMMAKDRLYSALGEIVADYYYSLDPVVRVGFANNAMTPRERQVFLNVLFADDAGRLPGVVE